MDSIIKTPQTDVVLSMSSIIASAINRMKEVGVDDIRIAHILKECLPTSAIAIWTKSDFTQSARDLGLIEPEESLTDEQSQEIAEALMNDHDATIGINWDVIDTILMDMPLQVIS